MRKQVCTKLLTTGDKWAVMTTSGYDKVTGVRGEVMRHLLGYNYYNLYTGYIEKHILV